MVKKAVGRTHICAVCKSEFSLSQLHPWREVRSNISALISADTHDWQDGAFICGEDLSRYRRHYIEKLLDEERGEIGTLEQDVISSLETGQTLSHTLRKKSHEGMSFGDRMADSVAKFGGSWAFILSFCGILVVWMTLNITGILFKPYDPYPFILLNLLLSCVAAFQAPIIMMSQRRQEIKDRQQAENDYKINLKAELEIRLLHEKIDHQIAHQWERLAEMQQIQIDLLEERNSRK